MHPPTQRTKGSCASARRAEAMHLPDATIAKLDSLKCEYRWTCERKDRHREECDHWRVDDER